MNSGPINAQNRSKEMNQKQVSNKFRANVSLCHAHSTPVTIALSGGLIYEAWWPLLALLVFATRATLTPQYYTELSIIRTQIIRIQTFGLRIMSQCFRHQQEKYVAVTGVLLQEKAKLLYERLFPDATTPFSASTGFRSRFTTSELAERSRECCSVAN